MAVTVTTAKPKCPFGDALKVIRTSLVEVGLGAKEAVTPDGRPLTFNRMSPDDPFTRLTMIVAVAEKPWRIPSPMGPVRLIPKSGDGIVSELSKRRSSTARRDTKPLPLTSNVSISPFESVNLKQRVNTGVACDYF